MKKSILNTLFLAVCWVGSSSQAQAAEKLKLDKQLKVRKVRKVRTVIDPQHTNLSGSTNKRELLSDERLDRTSAFPWTVPTIPVVPIIFMGAKAPPKLGTGKTRVAGLSAPSNNPLQSLLNSVPTVVTPPPPVPPVNPNTLRTNIQHEIQTNWNNALKDEHENVNSQIPFPTL